jgi:hypothetical protein
MFEFSHFAQLLVNILAVGGGFLVGYFLTLIAANTLDRAVLRKKSPRGLHKVLRFLGGLLGAILVALIVFGHGQGWNLFGGAAGSTGTGNGRDAPQLITTPANDTPPETPKPTLAPTVTRIRITILGGGDVKSKHFYKLDDDPNARTFDEVKAVVQPAAKQAVKPGVEIRFAQKNRLPQDHPAVTMLVQWLRESCGLTVAFPPDGS